jgi:hypothetical protein
MGLTKFNETLGKPTRIRNKDGGKNTQVGKTGNISVGSKTSLKKNIGSQVKIPKGVDQVLTQELKEKEKKFYTK